MTLVDDKARNQLNAISKKHQLNPTILQNVIWGKSQGWSQGHIANEFNYNPNTISRYNRILKNELSADEVKELLVIIGLLLGAAYLLDKLMK